MRLVLLSVAIVTIAIGCDVEQDQKEWRCERTRISSSGSLSERLRNTDAVARFEFPVDSARTTVSPVFTLSAAGREEHYDLVYRDMTELIRLRLDSFGCTIYYTHIRNPQSTFLMDRVLVRLVRRIGNEYIDWVLSAEDSSGRATGYQLVTQGSARDFSWAPNPGELKFTLHDNRIVTVYVDTRTGEQGER